MGELNPSYRFVTTLGGSGPVLTFERTHRGRPLLRELVAFQKGLHGSNWFRVNFVPVFVGAAAGGKTCEHTLWEGATLGPDRRWKSAPELESNVRAACTRLEDAAAKFFKPYEAAYARYEKLYGDLVRHYTEWMERVGQTLPASDFAEDVDADSPKVAAFASFAKFLQSKKLTAKIVDPEVCLWRFWHESRPMRKDDYRRGDDYDCARCGSFTSLARGKLVRKRDPIFGPHYEYVCSKH